MSNGQHVTTGRPLTPADDETHDHQAGRSGPGFDFTAFITQYEKRLRRFVRRRIGDGCDADEITQETLLRAYQHRASFGTENELVAWCTVVAQRLVIDRIRVRGRFVAVAEVPEEARLGRDTADIVVARDEARCALSALAAVPSRQAAVLWAREVEGLHYREIADRFSITEPAVRSLLHRGRRALRQQYAARNGTLPLSALALGPYACWRWAARRLRRGAAAISRGGASVTTAALAIAGFAAYGYDHLPRPERRPPMIRTPDVRSARPPRADGAAPATGAAWSAGAVAAGRGPTGLVPVVHVPWTCAVDTCVGSNEPLGETLRIGRRLPDNPAGADHVEVSQDYVPLCRHVPDSPAATCHGDNSSRDESTPRDVETSRR